MDVDGQKDYDWVESWNRTVFASQSRKESFLIMVMCYRRKETAWRKK